MWTWTCPCGSEYSRAALEDVQEVKAEHVKWHARQLQSLIKEASFPPSPGYDAPV